MLLEIMGTDDFPPQKKNWRKLAGSPSPHRHRIEVTIQYLTILVEPSKRSKESRKIALVSGCFGWGCSLQWIWIDRKSSKAQPQRCSISTSFFLAEAPEFLETFPSVLLSQKNATFPNRRTSNASEGWSPSDKPEVDAISKADQHRWCESGFFSPHPHWGKGSAAKGGQLADDVSVEGFRWCFFFVFLQRFLWWYCT